MRASARLLPRGADGPVPILDMPGQVCEGRSSGRVLLRGSTTPPPVRGEIGSCERASIFVHTRNARPFRVCRDVARWDLFSVTCVDEHTVSARDSCACCQPARRTACVPTSSDAHQFSDAARHLAHGRPALRRTARTRSAPTARRSTCSWRKTTCEHTAIHGCLCRRRIF